MTTCLEDVDYEMNVDAGGRLSSLVTFSHSVQEVISEVNHASERAQDQNVHVVVDVDLVAVVLHRKDAVHRDSHHSAEVFHLSVPQKSKFSY